MRLSRTGREALAGAVLSMACVLALRSLCAVPGETLQPSAPVTSAVTPAAHADPVASYDIDARLDTVAHSVHATGTIEWRNRSTVAVREVFVHLYLNAFKNSQSAFMQERRPGVGRGTGTLREFASMDVKRFSARELGGDDLWKQAARANPELPDDETDFRVPLPAEVAPGQTIHFEVEWDSKLPSIVERTGFQDTFHMVGQWFPKIARLEDDGSFAHFPFHHLSEFYADFGTYDVRIDVPSTFRIAAVGKLVSEKVEGGRRIERYQQADIHDFAFSAWDRFVMRDGMSQGVRVRIWYPPGFDDVAAQELRAAELSLAEYGSLYGAYPYEQLTIVHPPAGAEEAGGMEYPTLITTGGPWYSLRAIGTARGVTIHELGHQYFYGLVATDEHRFPFLDEGLTTFAEGEVLSAGWGAGGLVDLPGLRVDHASIMRWVALEGRNAEVVAQPAERFSSASSYSAHAYMRAGLILITLDRVYPGTVRRSLGTYARKFRFRHPTPDALVREFEAEAGADAAKQLKTAIHERGWIDYAIQSIGCELKRAPFGLFDSPPPRRAVADSYAALDGFRCDVVVARRGTLTLPVDIDLVVEGGSRTRRRWDGVGDTTTLRYEGAAPVDIAVVDPEHRVLLDEDLTNNAVRRLGPARARQVVDGVLYAAQLALSGATP
ncbi:MAG: M1 family metallopeptidase [Deltaproteobacteria bacterium]|nr:M1 family metallopeptidase [Deltaproteobacteria bacterium]